MKIQTKISIIITIALLLTSAVIGTYLITEINGIGNFAVDKIETSGKQNIAQIAEENRAQAETIRGQILSEKKAYLKSQVQTTLSVVEKAYSDAHDIDRLKELYRTPLENAVNTAFGVIEAAAQRADLEPQAQQELALQTIKALRYGPENKDYFWINDLHPRMVMHPYKPALDGQDLSDFKDPNGKRLFVAFADVCREKGAGFVDYHWPKYGADKPQPKLSFVKLYKPWGWIIGSGVYLEVAEAKLKADATQVIKSLRYGPDSKDYFWINDMGPRMIMHPYKPDLDGKDLSKVKDPNGKHLFMEFVKVCNAEGEGFVDYHWPKYGADDPQPKLSFVKEFKKWNWIIGTGIYIDDVEILANQRREALAASLGTMSDNLQGQARQLKTTVEEKVRNSLTWSVIGVMGILLMVLVLAHVVTKRTISGPIEEAIVGLINGSQQVAMTSREVSAASRQMADGASGQAAATDVTTTSLEQIAVISGESVDRSKAADLMMSDSMSVVATANESMTALIGSMEEISAASEETSKIIKTIDEIAFQTNLLALNAAVEAARAGEAGAGFAVVADEVRNLAMRAAEAARNTTNLIKKTTNKVHNGTAIMTRSNEAFRQVTDNAGEVADLISKITTALGEQAQSIREVTQSIQEIDKITQQNAASAEESASASAEMQVQSESLDRIIDKLVMMTGTGQVQAINGCSAKGGQRIIQLEADVRATRNVNVSWRRAKGSQPHMRDASSEPENLIDF